VEKSIKVINKVNENDQAFVDPDHFAIIFRNLVSNALKFTHEQGTIIIDAQEANNSLIISISDNGIGMDPATLNKVWHNQEHHSTYGTSMEKGTGIGLSLCKEMVEKNKGNITVESMPGKGTTFYVEFPTPSNNK
jgi:signal transduction histidine kinase